MGTMLNHFLADNLSLQMLYPLSRMYTGTKICILGQRMKVQLNM